MPPARPTRSPPELRAADIVGGAAELGLSLNDGQLEALADFARMLMRWNAVHNLTAVRSAAEVLTHHLFDCLAIVPAVAKEATTRPVRLLDVGSGGGLPGIVLAIVLPEARVTLVDSVQKKCAFLTQAKLELGLRNVEVVHGRIERLQLPPFDVIVSRALASLAKFVEWTRHLLGPGGCWLAMKGKLLDAELAELPADVAATVVPVKVPGLDEQRHLVEVRRR